MRNLSSDEPSQTKTETYFQKKKSRTQNHRSCSPKPPAKLKKESNDNILNIINGGNRSVALASFYSGNLQALEEKCKSMMEKTFKKDKDGNVLYSCATCGKEAKNNNLKNHIEANHLEGISIPCNFCEATFRTRQAFRFHLSKNHKESPVF